MAAPRSTTALLPPADLPAVGASASVVAVPSASAVDTPAFPIANPDKPQAACVLLLDTSRSMRGAPIRALQEGLEAYRSYLRSDEEAKLIVETSIITFGDEAKVVHPFSAADDIPHVALEAKGWTSMGAAIELGIQEIEARKAFYREEGVDYYRPFLVLITDGAPTDLRSQADFDACAAKLQQGARDRKFIPLFFGTGDANFEKLKRLLGATGTVAGIDGVRFEEFFQWLSKSMGALKDSKPGDKVAFQDPTAPTADQPNPFAFEV